MAIQYMVGYGQSKKLNYTKEFYLGRFLRQGLVKCTENHKMCFIFLLNWNTIKIHLLLYYYTILPYYTTETWNCNKSCILGKPLVFSFFSVSRIGDHFAKQAWQVACRQACNETCKDQCGNQFWSHYFPTSTKKTLSCIMKFG
jgi:hypothetical protein